MKEADWIIHLDIDEFLNIHVGDGQIADLIAALPDADAIALTSDNPSREFYKLQLARRDMLRHLRTLFGAGTGASRSIADKTGVPTYLTPTSNRPQICRSTSAGGTNGARIIP